MGMWFEGWEKHDWRLTLHLLVAEKELYLFKIYHLGGCVISFFSSNKYSIVIFLL